MLFKLIKLLKGIFMNEEETPVTEETPSEAAEVQSGVEVASEIAAEDATVTETVVAQAVEAAPVTVFYNGQAVVERHGVFDADGAEECFMADGSTVYVPKSVLGE